MPRVVYVHPNGERDERDAAVGASVMQGAMRYGYVDPERVDGPAPMSADGVARRRRSNGLLGCQPVGRPDFDGSVVGLPERQV